MKATVIALTIALFALPGFAGGAEKGKDIVENPPWRRAPSTPSRRPSRRPIW
jgi:hypothetical protein